MHDVDIESLIQQRESNSLDFKREFHSDNSSLVHDIMCLANADVSGNRFLVFGVDDSLTVIGVERDEHRKDQAKIITTLRNARFYELPSITLQTYTVRGHEIDVLIIEDRALKPYVLTHDYRCGKKTVRAGVAYTREGDTNTPINSTASLIQIERMFKQRFHLDLPAKDRMLALLDDSSGWSYGEDESCLTFHHKFQTDFVMQEKDDERARDFNDPWVKVFPDAKASTSVFVLRCRGTKLDSVSVAWCDGARLVQVLPETYYHEGVNDQNISSYYLIRGSLKHRVQMLFNALHPQDSIHHIKDVIAEFDSKAQAKDALRKDILNNESNTFCFFEFDKTSRHFFMTKKSKRIKLNRD